MVQCDIVLPVYNALSYTVDCLQSVAACTAGGSYRLLILDDGSDARTAAYLAETAVANPGWEYRRNPQNLGFLKSCNLGMRLGEAPYVLLLNSDVVVTPGWLERLVRCAESDPRIASVNPLTNCAPQMEIAMPPGASFAGMDWALRNALPETARTSAGQFPTPVATAVSAAVAPTVSAAVTTVSDVVTGVGFCMLLRRAALNEVGLFDEAYGMGYCEESDLCMRLTAAGWRTVTANNVYVYHKGKATFQDRADRYVHNRKIFDSRWAPEYEAQFRAHLRRDPLRPIREEFRAPQKWNPSALYWENGRAAYAAWRRRDFVGMARAGVDALRRLPSVGRPVPSPALVEKSRIPGQPRVTYIMNSLGVSGGALSVVQLVNELTLRGFDARIATTQCDPAIDNWTRLYSRPLVYENERDLIENLPDTDLAIATYWETSQWVRELIDRGKAARAVHFVQDYEEWFFDESRTDDRARVRQAMELVPQKIVMSDWLAGMLEKDGLPARKIRIGMDPGVFYPRDPKPGRPPTVIAMARPNMPRRGFAYMIPALQRVKELMPGVRIILFGNNFLQRQSIPFEFQDEAVVFDQNRLAALYSESDLFLDASDYQGFGRCGLEAMACGCSCVLTDVGGVNEYARDGENCLLVPPKQPDAFSVAILNLLGNAELRGRLVAAGLHTSTEYHHKREAAETAAYFRELLGDRDSGTNRRAQQAAPLRD